MIKNYSRKKILIYLQLR